MKNLPFLLLFLSLATVVHANEIIMKITALKDDKTKPKVEYAFYDGDKKIASYVLDIRDHFKVIERTGEIPDGIVKLFLPPDQKDWTEFTYKNGQKNGEAITYFGTGEKMSVQHYKNDDLEGLQQSFTKEGILTGDVIIHRDGQPSIDHEYYANGKLKSEVTYLIGKSFSDNKTLTKKTYDENGNLTSDLKAQD